MRKIRERLTRKRKSHGLSAQYYRYVPKKSKVEESLDGSSQTPDELASDVEHKLLCNDELMAAESLLNLGLASSKMKSTPRFHTKRYPWKLVSPRSRKLKKRCLFTVSTEKTVSFVATETASTSASELVDSQLVESELVELVPSELVEPCPSPFSGATNESVPDDEVPHSPPSSVCVPQESVTFGATETASTPALGVPELVEPCPSPSSGLKNVHSASTNGNEEELKSVGIQCSTDTRSIGLQCERAFICYDKCSRTMSSTNFRFFTGVTQDTFEVLYSYLGGDKVTHHLKYAKSDGTSRRPLQSELTPKDRLFMTLIRLRRGVPIRDLAIIFNMSYGMVSSIVYTWIRFLSVQLKPLLDRMFVSSSAQDANKPSEFAKFHKLRAILDCTEFKIQKPFHFQTQSNTYSQYKSTNTVKYLIAISSYGGMSFLSKGFEGSVSDKQIVFESGFFNHLLPNESIMCDRGFDIEPELNEIDVDLIIPPFLGKRSCFTAAEAELSKDIASARIFVEISIKRIKDFRILRGQIPNKRSYLF